MVFQVQLFGKGNVQEVSVATTQSLAALLVNACDQIKQRGYPSQEVRDFFFDRLDETAELLNQNPESTLETSKYIIFPFKSIAVPENLQNQAYILSILDALSLITFTENDFELLDSYINISISERNIFGVYFTEGQFDLIDSYTRLVKNITDQKIEIPPGFVCIALGVLHGENVLDGEKAKNIVTDIVGDASYIKPLEASPLKCVCLSTYTFRDFPNLLEAQSHVKEVLGIG